ncbi:uncharacterized protein MYCGRDRAFT_107106 [Zymoseptoria tritici IPO323]|uniref:Protein EFR3 n=1 Tax=Zymoseptoria tritici (strain CBS 115943 / IPO323) TaxID=336722 RepID=F9X0Y1_ZYMTI|nr:uncharacterized protein MYCGRDRAFT_107106 [Zymoseptoria tritici IPO323]EGP91173.1 hypothetical protein MYCGRDRAFT_107106 [Zymoseptoria tritici IPO323]
MCSPFPTMPTIQKMLPRHQALVLKCYPRLPKNSSADNAQPNSSELAYLLYYSSTRQEKLHKVGAFLERKTQNDVAKWQSARVHVTLQILTAMLEHAEIHRPHGFAIIAPSILRIIRQIINSTNDISLIEATIATWDAFCRWQDCLALAADSEYRTLFEEVVRQYGDLAQNKPKKLAKSTQSIPEHDALRMRNAGVTAFKSLFVPGNVERGWNIQFNQSFTSVISNFQNTQRKAYIAHLDELNKQAEEEKESSRAMNGRQSIATVRTYSQGPNSEGDVDPRAAEGTAQDADKLEEEEVGLLALNCVKAVFQSDNFVQVRGGATAFTRTVAEEVRRDPSFAVEAELLFRLITTWTPVHHRFNVLVTAVDHLCRLPIETSDASMEKGSNLDVHDAFITMIHGVLSENLNFIGLSVMDVLLRLLDHIIRLATTGSRANITSVRTSESMIEQLKDCIALLAVHVYYADQVRDMIAAILLRVKAYAAINRTFSLRQSARQPPTPPNATTTNSMKNGLSAGRSSPTRSARGSTISSQSSSDEARTVAFEMITMILEYANTRVNPSGAASSTNKINKTRHLVPVGTWEGTQWLLREPSEDVRQSYKVALQTWAKYELDSSSDPEVSLDFDAEDCIGKLVEKARPAAASIRGSIGHHSHVSHPQLLMLPYTTVGGDRRLSNGTGTGNNSIGTGTDVEGERTKPRVTAKDLNDIMEGKKRVPLRVRMVEGGENGIGAVEGEGVDMEQVLATLKVASERPKREPLMSAPPY